MDLNPDERIHDELWRECKVRAQGPERRQGDDLLDIRSQWRDAQGLAHRLIETRRMDLADGIEPGHGGVIVLQQGLQMLIDLVRTSREGIMPRPALRHLDGQKPIPVDVQVEILDRKRARLRGDRPDEVGVRPAGEP